MRDTKRRGSASRSLTVEEPVPALQTTDDKEREPAMARKCLQRMQGFSISEIDPIAGTMTFTNAGEIAICLVR